MVLETQDLLISLVEGQDRSAPRSQEIRGEGIEKYVRPYRQ